MTMTKTSSWEGDEVDRDSAAVVAAAVVVVGGRAS